VLENARMARTTEKGCRQFDVSVNPEKKGEFFLYEVYDDRAAFDVHQASAHLKAFREKAGSMLKNRNVRFLSRVAP
jgi:quinol monooxygenase YgiN